MDFEESCRPGIPTAPRALRSELKDGYDLKHKSALLRWWPSQVFDENGNTSQEHSIIGFRIYVNGLPKGMVKAHKNRALVEGMRIQNEYKITVVAIGSLGDSNHSNAAIIYVPNSEILAQHMYKKKEENLPSKKKTAISRAGEAGKPVNPKNDTLDDVLDKAAEVLEKVAQSQEAGNESHNSNRDSDFDSKENTFPGADSSASTLCPEKYKLSTKVEVESIEDIIRKAKENFKDSQSKIMKSSFYNSDEEEQTENHSKKEHEEEEDYSKLLKDLDEEDDEDIVAKVLKRYGLNKHDFDYARPESSEEIKKEPQLSFQTYMPVHEISLD
jgi:hypothetical protein